MGPATILLRLQVVRNTDYIFVIWSQPDYLMLWCLTLLRKKLESCMFSGVRTELLPKTQAELLSWGTRVFLMVAHCVVCSAVVSRPAAGELASCRFRNPGYFFVSWLLLLCSWGQLSGMCSKARRYVPAGWVLYLQARFCNCVSPGRVWKITL